MPHYFTVSTVSELVCLLVSFCLVNDRSLVWRSLILYMLITCLAEFSGVYIERTGSSNHWVYNILVIFDAGFMSLMFAHLFKRYEKSRFIIVGLILFIALYTYQLTTQGLFEYDNLTFASMSVVYVVYCLYYYLLLIRDEDYANIRYSPAFWWVTGAVFFYFGNTACNLFAYQFGDYKTYQRLSYTIFKILNVLQYGLWSYSFICKRWLIAKSNVSY